MFLTLLYHLELNENINRNMTIKKILTEPNPFLRQKSVKVDEVNDEIRSLMDDMLETMYAAPGIGLASIQIGFPKRVIVIDLSRDDEKKNPFYFALEQFHVAVNQLLTEFPYLKEIII